MNQEQVIELAEKAGFHLDRKKIYTPYLEHVEINDVAEKFAALVEQATLERAAEKLESQHTWITNIAASALIRNLAKDTQWQQKNRSKR